MKNNQYFQKLKRIINLSIILALANFKLRNEGSFAGIFWYLLNPIILFFSLFAIFSDKLGNNIPRYPAYLFLGIIMFNLFRSITVEASKAIRENYLLIKSINFPKEALIGDVLFKNIFSHFFEIVLLALLLVSFNVPLMGLVYYFILLAIFCIFIFSCALFMAVLSVYFIDLANVWIYTVQILWFLTPIFYATEGQLRLLYFNYFNPVYYFITAARDLVIYNRAPATWIIFGLLGYTFIFLCISLITFNKLKGKIPELI